MRVQLTFIKSFNVAIANQRKPLMRDLPKYEWVFVIGGPAWAEVNGIQQRQQSMMPFLIHTAGFFSAYPKIPR